MVMGCLINYSWLYLYCSSLSPYLYPSFSLSSLFYLSFLSLGLLTLSVYLLPSVSSHSFSISMSSLCLLTLSISLSSHTLSMSLSSHTPSLHCILPLPLSRIHSSSLFLTLLPYSSLFPLCSNYNDFDTLNLYSWTLLEFHSLEMQCTTHLLIQIVKLFVNPPSHPPYIL